MNIQSWVMERWPALLFVAAFFGLLFYILWLKDPRYLERAMARKREKELVAKWISQGLDNGLEAGELSADIRLKYNKKLSRALDLPDLMPKQKFDLNKAKGLSRQRLDKMGVHIATALSKMRRNKANSKKAELLSKVKRTRPLPLP